MEQLDAQAAFQRIHVLAGHGRGHVQVPRCCRQASSAGSANEHTHAGDAIEHGISHYQ
jgi:hypothetical protein